MKVDNTMILENPLDAGAVAAALEEIGYDTAYSFEGQHDPFLPLAIAAQTTNKITLGTGIAVAFARNPMNLANLGYDLQLITKGRFILGLGTQIQPHIEKRFGAVWSKPAARMREMILAIRHIWQAWESDGKLNFEGEFYRHTLMTPTFNPGPNPHGLPKIFAAGVGPLMTEAMGEVADGFFIHPFNTEKSLRQLTLPALQKGFDKAGKSRDDFEISCSVIVGTGNTEEQMAEAILKVRKQIAFYGSTPAYRPILECHGWGELHKELNRLSKLSQWDDMANLIDDEVLNAIAIICPRELMAERITQRLGGLVDRVNLVARYTGDESNWRDVVRDLKA